MLPHPIAFLIICNVLSANHNCLFVCMLEITAQSTLLMPWRADKITFTHFYGQANSSKRLINSCALTIVSNLQLPTFNQWMFENDRNNNFMVSLHDSCVAELGFERDPWIYSQTFHVMLSQ